jgi:hypothetical protein
MSQPLSIRFLRAIFFTAFVFTAPAASGQTTEIRSSPTRPAIRVVDGDWGRARPEEIEAVLRSAADVLLRSVGQLEPLAIAIEPGTEHPEVQYEKNSRGEYVIVLSARDRGWAQYAYQFSHELCHVLANFDHRISARGEPLSRHQWFEETLCDTAALFALRAMAARWESAPPFSHWQDYAPWLAAYADEILAAEHRRHAQLQRLPAWYVEHRAVLAQNPYARQLNDFCAAALLPLFEADPARWNALRYLNLDGAAAEPTFDGYLARWQRSSPDKHRAFIRRLEVAFGSGGVDDTRSEPAPAGSATLVSTWR